MTGLQSVFLGTSEQSCSVATLGQHVSPFGVFWLKLSLCFLRMFGAVSVLSIVLLSVSVSADVAKRGWFSYEPASGPAGLVLNTDVKASAATELLHELARFDVLVDQYIEPFVELAREIAPQLEGRRLDTAGVDGLTLLVLSKRRDFVRMFKPSHFSAFTLPTLDQTTLVVGPIDRGKGLRENLLHEYVHYRLRRDVPGGLPLWFEEGLASYLSKVKFHRDSLNPLSLRVELGRWALPKYTEPYSVTGVRTSHTGGVRENLLFADKAMRLSDLLARRNLHAMPRSTVEQFYHTSHALVRHLYANPELDRAALAAALVLDTPNFPAGVDVDLKAAGRAIRRHYDSTSPATERFNLVGPAEVAVAQQKLSVSQIRRRLADAALTTNPAASANLYEQLAEELPNEVWPWLGSAKALRLQSRVDEAKARLAVAQKLAPEHPAVLLEQAATRTSGCIVMPTEACPQAWLDSMLDLRDALDHNANSYEAIYRLGIAHLYLGQPGEAQGYLQVAWQRVPWSPRVNFFIGESMRLAGDTRARWYLDGAQRWAVTDYYAEAAAQALRLLPAEPG